MNSATDANAKKIHAAETALANCLTSVESAVKNLRSVNHGIQYASTIETTEISHTLQNATILVALSLQRIEDASKRLLKRLGHDTKAFEKRLRSSIPIQVTVRLADSWKHGLGGQQSNATVLSGVVSVRRQDGYRDESGQERVLVVGVLVADAADGVFVSTQLFEFAVKHWAALLHPVFAKSYEWAARVFPEPKGPVIEISRGTRSPVPLGSTVFTELPDDIQSLLKNDARKRGESA